jgi:hypothetical protein
MRTLADLVLLNFYQEQYQLEINLKCTFRRCVDRRFFKPWEEVVSLVSTIVFPNT